MATLSCPVCARQGFDLFALSLHIEGAHPDEMSRIEVWLREPVKVDERPVQLRAKWPTYPGCFPGVDIDAVHFKRQGAREA